MSTALLTLHQVVVMLLLIAVGVICAKLDCLPMRLRSR